MEFDMYWFAMYMALFLCVIYNIIISHNYGIKRWKFIIITLFCFAYNWGVSYLAAWIEAGFTIPPTVNGVRAWIFCPLYFLICSFLFNINFKRLSDAITPCFILGFSLGHIGCVFAGCCNGYPYDGPFAIWNERLGYYCFPIQIVECLICLALFIGYVVYNKKTKYKITGKLYPIMLVLYTYRIITELFRDNIKVFWRVSPLSFHAIAGCIVGLVWLFFTTAKGKRLLAKIRKKVFKTSEKILSLKEYDNMINEDLKTLNTDSFDISKNKSSIEFIQISLSDFEHESKKIFNGMSICILLSIIIGILCIVWLKIIGVTLGYFLVSFFLLLCIIFLCYCLIIVIRTIKFKKNYINNKKSVIFTFNPFDHKLFMTNRGKYYYIDSKNCSHCKKKIELYLVSSKKIRCSCITSAKHAFIIDEKYVKKVLSV